MTSALELASRNTEEIVTKEELEQLCARPSKTGYIGFEPSGHVHLGWKLCASKIRDLTEAGFSMTVLLADWHAHINDKLGGDLDRIRTCAEYMKDALESLGVTRGSVKYVYASDYVGDPKYWEKIIRISKATSLSRIKRAMDILGRSEDDVELDSSRMLYPMMQVADIFHLDVDMAYGGLDQRKAHMLARDVAEKYGWKKVTAIHTPLLSSLTGNERMDPLDAKMSKSKPDSAVFIHDSPDDIKRKLKGAFCPAKQVENNPVLDLCRHIIFPAMGKLAITRPAKWGGNLEFPTYENLTKSFAAEQLHPADLKGGVSDALIEILAPVRKYFEEHPSNWEKVNEFRTTR